MKTSLIFAVAFAAIIGLAENAFAFNCFSVQQNARGIPPLPNNGVWNTFISLPPAYPDRALQGNRYYYNDPVATRAYPTPGRPCTALGNVGNTGNIWAPWAGAVPPLGVWDELDAMDTLGDYEIWENGWLFSVDEASVGLPAPAASDVWNVNNKMYAFGGPRAQAGSIFYSPVMGGGVNMWAIDGVELGLKWPGPPGTDNLDAYDYNPTPNGQLCFSLATGSPYLDGPDGRPNTVDDLSGADIIGFDANNPGAGIISIKTGHDLGLLPGDDIDALIVLDIVPGGPFEYFIFSLAPGSPSLAAFVPPPGAPPASPADIFGSFGTPDGQGQFHFIRGLTAASLGLDIKDNIDALDTNWVPRGDGFYDGLGVSTPDIPFPHTHFYGITKEGQTFGSQVPEPSATILLAMASIWLLMRVRKTLAA